ncbi:hypothetical protein [Sphingobacterium hungaricum]|uniref:Uncharacterized protein n=1 Tax=Sphingobacterium hungaricum TaxID=2082723 RepID=A0A928YRP5_9SPHI|nr:hypothetical protein [Sphingobacterium hungaricum]MBE8714882.1 hypothetical protein [Sphingobacterium hungaricum]
MKTFLFTLLLLPLAALGQLKMKPDYGTGNSELRDILKFEKIDYFDVKIAGPGLKGRNYMVISKTISDGVVSKIDTILNTAKITNFGAIDSDTLHFSLIGKKFNAEKLKLFFNFKNFTYEKLFDAIDSDDYSLRDIGKHMDIEVGKSFHAFAYILPYEKGNYKMYCAVDSSGKDVENWGKEFGIKHYIIFDLCIK